MDGKIFALLFVPMILFITVVMPMWLNMYYRDKRRQSRELSQDEWAEVERTLERAAKLEERIANLEAILDAQDIHWKEKS
ncbi:MAG: envelope stress response membrane protein PspB [Pseudomonadales bacterium]